MQDSYYCYWVYHAENVVDAAYCEKVELCYECLDCARCYNCDFCQDCKDSFDLAWCYDCTGWRNCLGCVGLSRREYCLFNEQKTKQEYEKEIAGLRREYKKTGRWPETVVAKYQKLKETVPHHDYVVSSEHCMGNHIEHSKNCFYSFDMVRSRDCFYNFNAYENVDSVDCSFTKAELGYENCGGGWNFNCSYILFCMNCADSALLFQCRDCKNCLGCDGLDHKEFYILNKSYSKEEYFKRAAEIWRELKLDPRAGSIMDIFIDEEFSGVAH